MGCIVSANAMMSCSFGLAPSAFQPTCNPTIMAKGIVGCAMDVTPANIPPFGMCTSMMNPAVITATAAAMGVLTPQPCTLIAAGMWITPKMNILLKTAPVLTTDAKLMCAFGGVIQFSNSPSMKVKI